MKKLRNTASGLAPGVSICILLLLWEIYVQVRAVPDYILPAPTQIIKTVVSIFPALWDHTITTCSEAIIGFGIAILFSLLSAFLLYHLEWFKRAIYPLFIFSQTIPLIVLAVLLPIWFGWGMFPKVLIVVLVCFFPIVLNLIRGLEQVDHDLLNLFRSMGSGRMKTFCIATLPQALPSFFAGVRISATYSIMAAVIGEWVGAQQGLGYFMTLQQKNFAIDRVLAAVMIISLLSYLLVKVVDLLEYCLVPWNRRNLVQNWDN